MLSPSPKFQRQVKSKKGRRRWWLFYAKDFQSLMYPCFVFCRILGILPYKITSSFETSKPCYVISIIVMCVLSFWILLTIYAMNISGWFNMCAMCSFKQHLLQIEFYCFFLFGNFIMIITFVLSGPRIHLLQTLLEISSRLPSESYQKQSILLHAKDMFGFFILLPYLLIVHYNTKIHIAIKIFAIYVTLLVFQMDMLYINCVCVLKTCFKKINDDLANLFIMNNKLYFGQIYHVQRNLFLLMELKTLKKRHLMLSNTVQRLNIIFSPQLLATISLTFISITLELYYDMVQWKNGWFISMNKQDQYLLFFITYNFTKIALIAWACETGKNQVIKINTIVHDLLNSTNDKQIKHELQLFSLQIMHRNNTFSAKGLILDATLFTAMINTITTYLLILIQFMIASHFCDEKTTHQSMLSNLNQAVS